MAVARRIRRSGTSRSRVQDRRGRKKGSARQCAQIANRGTYKHDCTPYPCEASRERWRGALLLIFHCRSHTRERLLLSDLRTWELAAPTIVPNSSWLLPRSTAIGLLNEEDTKSSRHLWWGPPAPTFWEHCSYYFSSFSSLVVFSYSLHTDTACNRVCRYPSLQSEHTGARHRLSLLASHGQEVLLWLWLRRY